MPAKPGGKPEHPGTELRLAAVGLEAEFSLLLDDTPVRPEDVFGDPRAFLRGSLVHRIGTSYQLPTGAAIYFDTGVIEVATPVIELERGCVARAGRSLWESIECVRNALTSGSVGTGIRSALSDSVRITTSRWGDRGGAARMGSMRSPGS